MDDQIKEISERLRGLRDVLQLSPQELADACEISVDDYLRAENGQGDIYLSMLQKIAKRYDLSLDELMFGLEPRMTTYFLTRYGKGLSVERTKAYKYQSLAGGFKGKLADPFLVTVDPNDAPITLNQHTGQEFDMVLKGRLLISLNGKDLVLNEGDSIYFNAKQLHGMKALDGRQAQFIAVII